MSAEPYAGVPAVNGSPVEPDLDAYDVVLINSSAGKDSQAMLTYLIELADRQGVPRARLVVVYASLGRVVWPGTLQLAQDQAAAYGVRFVSVARAEDLLDQVETRRATLDAKAETLTAEAQALRAAGWERLGQIAEQDAERATGTPAWPSSAARYCTSDQKTAQVAKLMTRMADEHRAAGNAGPLRILNCLGIRAAESPDRAKKVPFGPDSASNGRREVTRWLPIFGWSTEQVWDTIHRSGLPWHPAYDAGMPRLSCVFCVMAGRRELVLAATLNPGLARAYVQTEEKVGHTFKNGLSMAEVAAEAGVTA
jgi:3'-phosphoadenosine 5'-phosphosulfate sulfotransferase (PAPS reductase)/FAD synthetase